MGTVPTGRMERELRALYLRWLASLPADPGSAAGEVARFAQESSALIARLGGQVASLGALAGFPTPKLLELSPHAGTVYDAMKQAAIQASIQAGISSKEAARVMFRAGMDKSYRRLERLARTETTSAYWKNGWDSVAALPAIVMVWGAENGKRTCDYCLSRDGLVVEDPNIRDHPNGRCTLIPTLRSQVKYKGTLQPDGSVTMDPRWSAQRVAGAKAQESAGPTTAEQRDPLSGKTNPAAPSQAQPAQASAPAPRPPAVVDWGRVAYDWDDIAQQVKAESHAWWEALGTEEQTSVHAYTGAAYQAINIYNREGVAINAVEGIVNHINNIDVAFGSSQTSRPLVAYRGQRSKERVADWTPGTEITMDSYTSASMERSVAKEFAGYHGQIIQIRVPEGSSAQYLNGHSRHAAEEELLFPKNARFKVVERNDNEIIVELIQ